MVTGRVDVVQSPTAEQPLQAVRTDVSRVALVARIDVGELRHLRFITAEKPGLLFRKLLPVRAKGGGTVDLHDEDVEVARLRQDSSRRRGNRLEYRGVFECFAAITHLLPVASVRNDLDASRVVEGERFRKAREFYRAEEIIPGESPRKNGGKEFFDDEGKSIGFVQCSSSRCAKISKKVDFVNQKT